MPLRQRHPLPRGVATEALDAPPAVFEDTMRMMRKLRCLPEPFTLRHGVGGVERGLTRVRIGSTCRQPCFACLLAALREWLDCTERGGLDQPSN